MKTNLIYFVHGTTYDNASKKCSGWKQVELNDLGKEQANKYADERPKYTKGKNDFITNVVKLAKEEYGE